MTHHAYDLYTSPLKGGKQMRLERRVLTSAELVEMQHQYRLDGVKLVAYKAKKMRLKQSAPAAIARPVKRRHGSTTEARLERASSYFGTMPMLDR